MAEDDRLRCDVDEALQLVIEEVIEDNVNGLRGDADELEGLLAVTEDRSRRPTDDVDEGETIFFFLFL